MSAVSKLTFIPFTPHDTDGEEPLPVYQSNRDSYRDVRERALHDPESVLPHVLAAAKLPPLPLTVPVLKFSRSRFSDLISPRGRVAPLSHRRPVSSAAAPAEELVSAKLPPLALTIPDLKFSSSRFSDLIAPRLHAAHHAQTQPKYGRAHPAALVSAPTEERVLDPHTLETILAAPLGPDSTSQPRERRQRSDANKARYRPGSNPEGKPMRARKVGALTSSYVLDPPTRPGAGQGRVLKPLSELRLPVMVSDHLGDYSTPGTDDGEADEIESFSDSEDESERRNRVKRRRCL